LKRADSLKLGHSQGKGIRRVRPRSCRQAQYHANHLGDLWFVRSTAASNSPFDESRRIFVNLKSRAGKYEQYDAASMTKFGCGLRILCEKQRFDARDVWRMLRDDFHETTFDLHKSCGNRGLDVCIDDAVR